MGFWIQSWAESESYLHVTSLMASAGTRIIVSSLITVTMITLGNVNHLVPIVKWRSSLYSPVSEHEIYNEGKLLPNVDLKSPQYW